MSCKMGTVGQFFGLICGGAVVLAVLLGTEGCMTHPALVNVVAVLVFFSTIADQ